MHYFGKLVFFTFLLLSLNNHASESNLLDDQVSEINLSSTVEIATSPVIDLHLKSLSHFKFVKNNKKNINLGYTNKLVLLKFTVDKNNTNFKDYFIYMNSLNGLLNLYEINEQDQLIHRESGGSDLPHSLRKTKDIFGALKIPINNQQKTNYVLSMKSRHNVNAQLLISNYEKIIQFEKDRLGFIHFYAGGILLLVIYNLFIFIFLKDLVYLSYCFYAFSFMMTSLVISGEFDRLFPIASFTFSHYLICFSALSLFSATLFTEKFLELSTHFRNGKKVTHFYKIISSFIFISGLLPVFENFSHYFGLAIDFAIFSALIFFIYCAYKIYKVQALAKFYLLSWLLVLFFIIIWFAMTFGFMPVNVLTQNALPIGSMLEMLTLALALAYKIEISNQEKIQALKKARDKERYARLVRVLSHDVANSLTVVSTYSKKLLRNKELDFEAHKQVEKIYQGTENIKNILKIVREEEVRVSTETHIELAYVNVLESIHFSKMLHEEALTKKNIELAVNIEEHLCVKADKTCFINNILNNLLSNAIKFSYADSKIDIFSNETEDFTFISMRDYGVGIKSDLVNEIFYSSKIVSTSGTEKEIGHGLGSSLIREYMILFGGKIQVTSVHYEENNLDHGTTIKLIFPKEKNQDNKSPN